MNLSAIKFVAADMDGTLLNAKHELSPDFFPVFEQMKAKGLLFASASGRQFFNIENKFKTIKNELLFIAENGSYVLYKGKELLVQAMESTIVHQQILTARSLPGVHTILCGKKRAYVESDDPEFMKHLVMYYDRYQLVDDLMQVEDDQFLKIALCDLAGAEKNSYPVFRNMQEQLQVKVSGFIWLDLSHKLANKGRAIEVVQNKFSITTEETMVFGDYLNDLEMMQQAYFSYAMENAHPEVKKVSRFLAKSNEDNGVTIVLQQMLMEMK